MTMTLEQVRDWHRRESWLCNSHKCVFGADATHKAHWAGKEKLHGAMADAIDAQLAQPAQSVAIYPVGHFIETSAGEYARVSRKHECDGDVFQLYRSTGNAQSVDVEKAEVWIVQDETGQPIHCASWPESFHEHINDAMNEHGIEEAKAWKVLRFSNYVLVSEKGK